MPESPFVEQARRDLHSTQVTLVSRNLITMRRAAPRRRVRRGNPCARTAGETSNGFGCRRRRGGRGALRRRQLGLGSECDLPLSPSAEPAPGDLCVIFGRPFAKNPEQEDDSDDGRSGLHQRRERFFGVADIGDRTACDRTHQDDQARRQKDDRSIAVAMVMRERHGDFISPSTN